MSFNENILFIYHQNPIFGNRATETPADSMRAFHLLWEFLIFVLPLVAVSHAQKVGVKSDIGFACFNSALNWNFGCPNELLPYDCRCTKDDFLTTAMNCVSDNAEDMDHLAGGWWYIRDQCHYWGARTMSLEEMGRIYASNKEKLINPDTINSSVLAVSGPIDVPATLFSEQLVGARDTKYHYNVGNGLAWGIFGYWMLILIGGVVTNAIRIICPNVYNVFGVGRVTKIRKFLTLPALAGKSHHSPLRLSKYVSVFMPTRGQSIIIICLFVINVAVIVSFIDVDGDTPLSFISQSDRKLHYLANRTGIAAVAYIPFIVLFASRNNIFIILTGWSYDTFMTYHRWSARLMAIQAIVHAVAMYWSSIQENVVTFKWERIHNWRGGNLAVYMVVIMLIMAMRRIRSRVYELFKMTHIVMFLIFIICMVIHLSDYGWLAWLYTALAFYGIEWVGRITRIVMSGGIQEARFTLAEEGMYRINVPGKHRKWDVKPGAYAYIRILDKNMFWQSHPFSLFQGPQSHEDNSIDFCCKAQMGSTRLMLQNLVGSGGRSFHKKVMIEGPYGNENYVSDYDSILLFAGGVGFTGMYSFASHIIKRLKPRQYLCMIWVVKDCGSLTAFETEIMHLTRQGKDICNFRIFVTKPQEFELGTVDHQCSSQQDIRMAEEFGTHFQTSSKITLVDSHQEVSQLSSQVKNTSNTKVLEYDGDKSTPDACHIIMDGEVLLNVDYGRPNISAEVCDFIRTANGSQAICSCGPPRFVDAIRDGIVESILDSEARVDYFEDAFSW